MQSDTLEERYPIKFCFKLGTDYLTKMGIKTVPQSPDSPNRAPCDFCLFPKFRGCRYETIKEMKEAVTKVIDTLTQEDFHGAFEKFLERCNKCIAAGGDYLEGDQGFICVLSIKVPIQKRRETYLMIYVYIYIYIYNLKLNKNTITYQNNLCHKNNILLLAKPFKIS